MTLQLTEYSSPLGGVTAVLRDGRLCAMTFTDRWTGTERALRRRFGAVHCAPASAAPLARRLDAYFAGDLRAFDDLAIDPGGTPFQQRVWAELRRIAPGSTTTYGTIARAIDAPTAVRAVGAANGANPIWLVIPCHRAIGADGRLVGYAGGLERKRWLLAHEGALAEQPAPALA